MLVDSIYFFIINSTLSIYVLDKTFEETIL